MTITRWGARWHDRSRLGIGDHLLFEDRLPALFRTRREARAWINVKYGYIKHRKDLRSEPHMWRMPIAVRVEIREKGACE